MKRGTLIAGWPPMAIMILPTIVMCSISSRTMERISHSISVFAPGLSRIGGQVGRYRAVFQLDRVLQPGIKVFRLPAARTASTTLRSRRIMAAPLHPAAPGIAA